ILVQILTYAIAFAGLSLSIRYNRRLNLSGAGFLALGAYGSAVLDNDMPTLISLVVTLIAAAVIAAFFAALTARMEMIYYVQISLLITAAAAEIISLASRWTQGNQGMSVSGYFSAYAIFGVPGSVLLVVVLAVASLLLVTWLGSSGTGVRALLTSRDRRLSESLGLRSRWQFIRIEAVSGTLLALSGALTAHTSGFISPDQYTVNLSIMMLAMVVLSGGWTPVGLALGAVIFVVVPVLVGSLNNLPQLIFGAVLIVVAMFAPSGVEGWLSAVYRGIGERLSRSRPAPADIRGPMPASSVTVQGMRHDK
ncbi:MAG: branched-chain amino acid ABC transporter permease, partial [Nocardiopsaceae bacterium]|nr:branched-chain amino acid ABC transporter permease [Nocardiopsaceae bacterium]